MQGIVNSALFDQFLVRAQFPDPAIMKNQNPVSLLDGLQPMSNQDRCPSGRNGAECILDYQFGLGVDAGCGFIRDQNFKISRH